MKLESEVLKIKKRFYDKFKINSRTNCWEWTACIKKNGYGDFSYKGKSYNASRVSWFIHNGEINDTKILVCHTCDNRKCVNPEHLFLGSHLDNLLDRNKKGRAKYSCLKGENHCQAKLTKKQVLWMREKFNRHDNNFNVNAFAKKFNVHESTIRRVVYMKRWLTLKNIGEK